MTSAECTPVTRTADFSGIAIDWDTRVLEPRAWTAAQARWAAELAQEAPTGRLLELCCGAGQIGLLAAKLSGRALVQVDRDEVAARYARRNADRAGIATDIRVAAMEEALAPSETFPVIVADPPWLRSDEIEAFPDDPVTAVDGGPDGLTLVLAAARVALEHLAPGGHIVLQVGNDAQADSLAANLNLAGQVRYLRPPSLIERRRCAGGVLVHLTNKPLRGEGRGAR